MIRRTPVEEGTKPYAWGVDSVYQCTWYSYFRSAEKSLPFPCWFDGHGANGFGSYTNAKEWLQCYRDPWEVKDRNYAPMANDIAVFDGEFGHVMFIEEVDGSTAICTEYRNGNRDSFRLFNWTIGTDYTGTLLGYLHCPYAPCEPVARNESKDQIQTTDDTLRIRTKPSLQGDIVGYVGIGYYDVLDTRTADGYTWYKIGKDRWCANVSTVYLPAEDDIIRQIDAIFKSLKSKVTEKQKEVDDLNERMRKIHEISEVKT